MRVLDTSIWRPMPHATQILADLGADVLKVEPPGGRPDASLPRAVRRPVPRQAQRGAGPEDRRRPEAGVASWPPRWTCSARRGARAWPTASGLGVDAVRAVNPTVIYCSLSGYGQTGPWRDRPGHDINFQARGRRAAAQPRRRSRADAPPPGRRPRGGNDVRHPHLRRVGGSRLQTGRATRIDVAMADVVAWWVGPGVGRRSPGSEQRMAGVGRLRHVPDGGQWLDRPRRPDRAAPLGCRVRRPGLDHVGLPPAERIERTIELNGELGRRGCSAGSRRRADAAHRRRGAGVPCAHGRASWPTTPNSGPRGVPRPPRDRSAARQQRLVEVAVAASKATSATRSTAAVGIVSHGARPRSRPRRRRVAVDAGGDGGERHRRGPQLVGHLQRPPVARRQQLGLALRRRPATPARPCGSPSGPAGRSRRSPWRRRWRSRRGCGTPPAARARPPGGWRRRPRRRRAATSWPR